MIIRSRNKNSAPNVRPDGRSRQGRLLNSEAFGFEIAREMSRSNRRSEEREFSLIIFTQILEADWTAELETLIQSLHSRLRITDSTGWLDQKLTVLLPETGQEGALVVANELAKRMPPDWSSDNDVFVFPWDDDLISLADELRSEHSLADSEPVDSAPNTNSESNANRRTDVEFRRGELTPFTRTLKTPWWKRSIDIVGASAGLILLSPIFLAASLTIKLSSRGPVFFVQAREGKNGKTFGIFKFRTMIEDAELQQTNLRDLSEQDGPAFKLKDDPRLTSVGKYLRKSCVDELPQLINVLKGDMSLVGPRPLPVGESYGCAAWQRARLAVLPGLTCTWQARGGREITFEEWMRMDLEYIRNQSFWLDLKLIFETAFLAVLHRGSV